MSEVREIVRDGRSATLEVSALSPLSNAEKAEIEPEALALLRMHAPQADCQDVAFGPLSRWTRRPPPAGRPVPG